MRNIILSTFLILLFITGAKSQSVNDFITKYKDDPSFTVVNISPKMFSLISGLEAEDMDPDLKAALQNITGMKILTKESDGTKYFSEAISSIELNKMEELMSVKEENSNVRIFGKNNGKDALSEVILLTGDKESFVLMQITGAISLQQLSKLSGTLTPPGSN
ncbi:DUF4252 domain-containing protein [Membranihabitans maritimus]|uniref:DUF4252 domain-containing protein n=1 Tax=Membranihabitans maritimus TaxID=2904244 RepID=UPI001F30F7A0|nr:DUF4252 domain-containing protein [Membranihabitans maritimus]